MNTNPNINVDFLNGLLSQLTNTNSQEPIRQVLENKDLNPENKPISKFMVTDVTVKQHITLSPNDFLKQLQSGELENTTSKIIVTGDLCIRCNSSIKKLPPNLEISGKLSISYCQNFTKFPENLKAKSLAVSNCNNITEINGEISIKDELYIHNCLQLKQIAKFTEIGKNLTISECPALTSFPEIENVIGNIKVEYCPNITTIPTRLITELKPTTCSTNPKVTLINTGISVEEIAGYNQQSVAGVDFILGVDTNSEIPFKNLTEACFYFNQFTDKTIENLIVNITEGLQEKLCVLFFVLAKDIEIRSISVKGKITDKVFKFIALANKASDDELQLISEELRDIHLFRQNSITSFKDALKRITYIFD